MWNKIFVKFQLYSFVFGVILGLTLSFLVYYPETLRRNVNISARAASVTVPQSRKIFPKFNFSNSELYTDDVAKDLFNKVKVLCWIMTTPLNHKTKAIHVKKTWGSRCNKLLFMSSETDADLESIALPVGEGRNSLWDKTKQAFLYVHQHHLNDADWFVKADDDT